MFVRRGVKASHILLSAEGRVYLSGLHSVYSMMREGKRMRVVFDMPHHSPTLLPWLSPELLRQVSPQMHSYDAPTAQLDCRAAMRVACKQCLSHSVGLCRTCTVTESSRTSTV